MEYRQLGNTDLELSAITYGAFAIGGTMWGGNQRKDSIAAIQASLDNGVSTLDTAPFYGFGLSEELIGEALRGRDRSKVQVLTKFGLIWDGSNQCKGEFFFDAGENSKPIPIYKYAAKESIMREVEASLGRLKTDYIDLLQLHWPDASTPIDETMETLLLLQQQGKIRAAGVSNLSVGQMESAKNIIPLASNQVPYSMLNRSIEQELVPYTTSHNIGIIAYSPLERGLLSGKYFAGTTLQKDDHRNNYFGQFEPQKVKALLTALQPLADSKNATLAQLVLRWTSFQKGITVVLAGSRNAEQAVANAKAMDINLTPGELQFINNELSKF